MGQRFRGEMESPFACRQCEPNCYPATAQQGNRVEFPAGAEWQFLVEANEKCPSFTMQNMLAYFVERKTLDDRENNDYKNICSKAYGLFKHGHVQNIQLTTEENHIHIRADCLPEMKKTLKYKLNLSLQTSGDVVYASCTPCPAGKGPYASCKHIASLCYALEEFSRLKNVRDFQTCTDRLQTWNQPWKRKLDASTVYEIDFSRKVYGRETKENDTLHDPRLPFFQQADPTEANRQLLEAVTAHKPNCGFFYLLSNEKNEDSSSMYEITPPIYQPLSKREIIERASQIKEKIYIDKDTIAKIRKTTKNQSESEEWFHHRKVRITASKCKRALLRPNTSPTKAIGEILGVNNSFQSDKMAQGLKDEDTIIRDYECILGCHVEKAGFSISLTHPFLGPSPDGEVDGGLVEVKRVFPSSLQNLHDAVFQGIFALRLIMDWLLTSTTSSIIKCNSKCFVLEPTGLT